MDNWLGFGFKAELYLRHSFQIDARLGPSLGEPTLFESHQRYRILCLTNLIVLQNEHDEC
jgi:hypothetical protein